MSIFVFQASDSQGKLVAGELEAAHKQAVMEHLEKRLLVPISIDEKIVKGSVSALGIRFFEHITPLDRILLVRNLAATVKAGLGLNEALDILIDDATKPLAKRILVEAKSGVESGLPLSKVFERFPEHFPGFFIGMLKAGEISGKMDVTLEELSRYMTREYNLAKRVKSAMAYPAILLTASLGVILLLLIFVLPRLQKTFSQNGVSLPLITRLMLGLSNAVVSHKTANAAGVIVLAIFFIFFRKAAPVRRLASQVLFRLPVVKELLKKIALVRFTRTLSSLIASGVSIIESLRLSSEAVGNESYKAAVESTISEVSGGVALSKSLERYPQLFPRFLTSLVTVGERTGSLQQILKTFAEFYDEEVEHSLKDLTTFLEPILLLFMGLVIGSIALSILLPIYQFTGRFT